jgi:hypothetical protein
MQPTTMNNVNPMVAFLPAASERSGDACAAGEHQFPIRELSSLSGNKSSRGVPMSRNRPRAPLLSRQARRR